MSARAGRVVVALALAVTTVSLTPLALGSCDDTPTPQPCTNVPEGGCPLSYGVACEDPACEAVYACRADNMWELDHTCPAHEASVPIDASHAEGGDADAAREPLDGSHPFDASVVPPGASGGPGCAVLESPDCSLGFALACPSGCCGCEDLFVCQNGGWTYWTTCKP
jgi:hypothetical protein